MHSLHKSAGLEPYQHARAARIVSIAGLMDARVSVKVTEKWTKVAEVSLNRYSFATNLEPNGEMAGSEQRFIGPNLEQLRAQPGLDRL